MRYILSTLFVHADKRAEQIDYVYYYTGDFTGIDAMNYAEIQSITKDAVLLWSK